MIRSLPYPGHSWSFTQHAVGLNAETLYSLLKCAAPFEGSDSDYTRGITALMIAADVLTSNERNGVPDAWRDYQQLLSELGLIVSTKICKKLTITELGQMYLAGEIGFSELIGMQALRYQYPNGQKSDISQRLRQAIGAAGISQSENLIELQTRHKILIKPGVLIFRILLELFKNTGNSYISISECQAFLVPCKSNEEWPLALHEILSCREKKHDINSIHAHARRNVQDWFKFLNKSDFFDLDSDGIHLSSYSIENLEFTLDYCTIQERKEYFWQPVKFDKRSRMQWFFWFGHISFDQQNTLRKTGTISKTYISENYVSGLEDEYENNELWSSKKFEIKLSEINFKTLGDAKFFEFSNDIERLVENIRKGAQKRHAKTVLHDRLVRKLAEKFVAQGAVVKSDPDSIDLFAKWKDGTSAIFEVKTVTQRSLPIRLRTAIGQIEEYFYRQKELSETSSDKVIVLNTEVEETAWQIRFLNSHMRIGLLCSLPSKYISYAQTSQKSKVHWAT